MASYVEILYDYNAAREFELTLKKGDIVAVDWDRSNWGWLWGVLKETGKQGWVPVNYTKKIWDNTPNLPEDFIKGDYEDDIICLKDATFTNAWTPLKPPRFAPGLDTWMWPDVSRTEWIEKYWQKKAYAVLGTVDRLEELKKDFFNLDIKELIDHSAEGQIVVWMKTIEGATQHFFATPEIAKQCFLGGSTLYMSPPAEVQRKYITKLCRDLGLDFGVEKEGDNGGDIEVFACRSRHVTPWHFDGQENFTIQLLGTKTWSIMPSGVEKPITNCHPSNTLSEKQRRVSACHRTYTDAPLPPTDFSKARTFTLRPGSVLYVPGGWWHKVVAESEETGSLSINFSLHTYKWVDLLANTLIQHLWKFPHWRDTIRVTDPLSTRKRLEDMWKNLANEMGQLTPKDILPDALFLDNRQTSVVVDSKCTINRDLDISEKTIFRRNPIASLVPGPDDPAADDSPSDDDEDIDEGEKEPSGAAGQRRQEGKDIIEEQEMTEDLERRAAGKRLFYVDMGMGNDQLFSTLQLNLYVKKKVAAVVQWVAAIKGDTTFTMAEFLKNYWQEKETGKEQERERESERESEREKQERKRKMDEEYLKDVVRVLVYSGCVHVVVEEEEKEQL